MKDGKKDEAFGEKRAAKWLWQPGDLVIKAPDGGEDAARRRQAPPGGRFDAFRAFDNARIRYARWPAPGARAAGTVLVLTGRREFIEKYFETVADLLARGFAVWTMDWRGQGLSEPRLADRHKGHVDSFDSYLRDLRQLREMMIKDDAPRPLLVLAHSMGAHLALRHSHDHAGDIDRMVLLAPMVALYGGTLMRASLGWLPALIGTTPLTTAYAPGQRDYGPLDRRFAGNVLTSDADRFADEAALIDACPDLALGGATWGWLKAATESMRILEAPGYAEAIATPSLIVGAGRDRVVWTPAAERLAARMPNARFEVLAQARHEILKETDAIRTRFWRLFDAFVASND